jgi:GntR family transcriptional repressor for pyruvate dehydrogenase complex
VKQHELFAMAAGVRTADVVSAQIQELIMERKISPGEALPSERELALLMSVSRNALREGIGQLVQKGLLVTKPGRGTFVAEPNFENMKESLGLLLQLNQVDLIELCDVRILLEPRQAALAAQNIRESDTASLERAMKNLRTSAHSSTAHVQADLEFHNEISVLAKHVVYASIVTVVREPITRGMVFGTKVPRAIDFSDDQHELIFEAIMAGRSVDAENAAREHLLYVREYLQTQRAGVGVGHGA